VDSQLDKFFGAWLAPELTLLGFRLQRPYCLGHALLLEAIESPYVHLGEEEFTISPGDLLIALQICATAAWPFGAMALRPTAWMRLQAWYLNRRPEAFFRANQAFVDWLRACSGRPEFWRDEERRCIGGYTAPEQLARACELIRKAPALGEQRIWSMPMGLVDWYYAAICEQEGGGIRFARDEDEEAPDDLDGKPDEELYEIVKSQRGEAFALQWIADRQEAKRRG
jgi:hypothetical protein